MLTRRDLVRKPPKKMGRLSPVPIANVEDVDGETPLFYAARSNQPAAILWLHQQHGLDVNQCNKAGMSPFWIAAACGHWQACCALHELDADLTLKPHTISEEALQTLKDTTPIQAAEQGGFPGGPAVAELLNKLEGLKVSLSEAEAQYQAANQASAPKEEQEACLKRAKEVREEQKRVYKEGRQEQMPKQADDV